MRKKSEKLRVRNLQKEDVKFIEDYFIKHATICNLHRIRKYL